MDYRYLQGFMSAAQELNFAKAAKRLRIAPSALSRQIALFEAALGGPCFTRTKRGVHLTSLGEAIYRRTVAYEDGLYAAKAGIHRVPLRIGCLQSIFESLLADLIVNFGKHSFALNLAIDVGGPRQLQEKLASGQLDCILNTLPQEGFHAEQITVEELVLVAKRRAHLNNPSKARWIVYTPLEGAWSGIFQRYQPNGIVRINSLNAAIELAARGGGITLIPEGPGLSRHGFATKTLPRRLREPVLLVFSPESGTSPNFSTFREALKSRLTGKRQ